MSNTILKSIGAVIAGLITVFVLSIVTDIILERTGLMKLEPFSFNPWWIIALVIICRCAYHTGGAYLTAALAPGRPMLHAMIIGISGVVVGISGIAVMWNKTPHWFPLTLAVLPLPCAWIGGKLKNNTK
jgi:hypothetical protein